MVFNWGGLAKEWEKVDALGRAFLSFR
jgi:hypothetical protein